MAREDFRFSHRLRVRWAEIDKQGIVFNGHYLTYFDVGVTEYYRATGLRYPDAILEAGSDFFARKAELDYHAPAEYDDEVDICARIARLGRSSFEFRFELYRAETLLVSGVVVYVNANPVTRKSAPLPEFLRDMVKRFEKVAPV